MSDGAAMPLDVRFRWYSTPQEVDAQTVDGLVQCWTRVSNAGGAIGFPFLPVAEEGVRAAAVDMLASLSNDLRILTATEGDSLLGWLLLTLNGTPLTRHWARVTRVQTDLPFRSRGIGVALMTEVARIAREVLQLEHLHIEVRGGEGPEEFYRRLGWMEVGRWPSALRLTDSDSRDEVLMLLDLSLQR